MKTFKFKTNLKCNNCVAKVKSQLDITDEIQSWSIDLKSPDRILTIKAKDEKAVASVERILAEAGYLAEVYPVESYITKNDKTMKDVKKESDKQSKPTTIKGCGCGNTEKPGKSQKMANDETTEDDIQGASNYERAESDQSKGVFPNRQRLIIKLWMSLSRMTIRTPKTTSPIIWMRLKEESETLDDHPKPYGTTENSPDFPGRRKIYSSLLDNNT